MASTEIWSQVRSFEGRILRTLDQRRPFDIVAVSESAVIVCPHSTRKERPIPRDGLEGAYRHLLVTGRLTLSEIESDFAPYNPVYVAAILAQLPGVRVRVRPTVLTLTVAS